MSTDQLFVEVAGMTCGGCVAALRNALVRHGLSVTDLEVGRVRIAVTEPGTEADVERRVREAITRAGFTPGDVRAVRG
jgi:hypothetical protein